MRLLGKRARAALLAATVGMGPGLAADAADLAPVTPARLVQGTQAEADWLHYGGDYAGWRYSALADITRENVARLAPVWMFQAGVQGQVAVSPVVADGILYFTVAHNNLFALDAVSGRTLWHYEHPLPADLRLCCGPANRGVAIAGDRVFMATLDARLVALDRASGKLLWNVVLDDYRLGYSATSAPLVAEGMVLIGSGGGEYGIRGFIDAYDIATGERRWRRYTVPSAGEPGADSWSGESWKTGGAPAWMTGAYDPASRRVYWTTGNPAPLFNGDLRAGDNLYSDSVLALDVMTGAIVWHFQYTPHDVWDFDATNNVMLIDRPAGESTGRALVQANRNGYVYVLDAADGRFLRASQYVERLNWAKGIDAQGRPVADETYYPSDDAVPKLICPGPLGGNNGSFSYAYSPDTHLLYVPTIESCLGVSKETIPFTAGEANFGGSLGDGEAGIGKSYGHLTAIDPMTGAVRWRYRDRYPMVGGALATGGGLVFTGNQEGYALGLDDRSGKRLWQFQTGSGIRSQPITYKIDGRQYVAIASGTGGVMPSVVGEPPLRTFGSALVVFALPAP